MNLGYAPGNRNAYASVVEHFPHRELAIRRLMQSDEVFREMCEELADAKLALSRFNRPSGEDVEVRREEWHDVVGRLVAELMTALNVYDASLLRNCV